MCATRLMPVAKKLGSSSAPGMLLANSGLNVAADGRDVDSDLLEHLAGHLAADAAAAGLAGCVGAIPRRVGEGRLRAGLALDLLERGANAVAQRFEPVARGLLLVVEIKHARLIAAVRRRRKRAYYRIVMRA